MTKRTLSQWLRGQPGDTEEPETETGKAAPGEQETEAEEQARNDADLTETRRIVHETSEKLVTVSKRLSDYQERVRDEYRKRLEMASGGTLDDPD